MRWLSYPVHVRNAALYMGQKAGGLKMKYNPQQARQQWQNRVNNAQGHIFEDGIKAACQVYQGSGRATVDKTPEPFRVMEKRRDGTFTGRFTALAAPDFQVDTSFLGRFF